LVHVTRALTSPNKPRVGITIGDLAGIGPEIVLKSVADWEVCAACRPVIIGDASQLRNQARKLGLSSDYTTLTPDSLAANNSDEPVICDTGKSDEIVEWGRLSVASGRASIRAIEAGVELCLSQQIDAMATAPINKEALKLSGSPFPGHTEMLAALTGAERCLMCFFAGNLRVFLLTIHVSLSDAIKMIKRDRVREAVVLADGELRRFGLASPRIAVAGINPHAGEHGLFGAEEINEIEPAVRDCRDRYGIEVSGPYPADTLFVRAARGEFDAVAACYHDQGLIAVKCLAFGKAVNVTLGLPIIRTSVDHGTAFDIAGRGVADPASLIEAIKLAARLVSDEGAAKAGI
jgi:4-hydroxythreonine-4-phosphate dehydrogenase